MISPKPRMRAGSDAKSVTRGSFCRLVISWTATSSAITGSTPSTSPGRCGRTRDSCCVALGEVAGAGRAGAVLEGEPRVDAPGRDDLVRLPECGQGRRTDRAAHRVAGRERSRDD